MERDRSHVLVFTEKWRSEENYSKKKKKWRKGLMLLIFVYLETSSHRGPFKVASRKAASISDLICKRA
jgi:hypothetical protein